MKRPLDGRVGIITGAGAGVGRGMAVACARAGASVVIAPRRAENGRAVVEEIAAGGDTALLCVCDVTQRADVEGCVAEAIGRLGHLDFFVHNATSNRSPEVHRVEDADADLWDEHAAVSIRGSYYAAAAAFEPLRASRGRFVVMTSPAGIEGSATLPFYGMVKAAQRTFAKSLAQEWGPHGINVNAISPLALTPALDRAFEENPELEERLAAMIPLGRIGDPETDIGAAAVALLGDAGRYVTAQTWVVDGGRFTGL